jgi:hypothetical protein
MSGIAISVRRERENEFRATLGEVETPSEPFQGTSIDTTGPYCITPRKNRYLITFIDHFTKWVEAFPIADVSADVCQSLCYTDRLKMRLWIHPYFRSGSPVYLGVFLGKSARY